MPTDICRIKAPYCYLSAIISRADYRSVTATWRNIFLKARIIDDDNFKVIEGSSRLNHSLQREQEFYNAGKSSLYFLNTNKALLSLQVHLKKLFYITNQTDRISLCISLIASSACIVTVFSHQPACAQDSQNADAGGAPFVLNVPRGNPLEGLFTPQPQYPKSHSLLNPEATPPQPGELNPLKGLFTPQPQFITPQTLMNPDASPPDNQVNHLKGLFTPPNQWATPQTLLNPQEEPRHVIPERKFLWGEPEERLELIRQHKLNTFGDEQPKKKPKSGSSQPDASRPDSKGKVSATPIRTKPSQASERQQSSPLNDALFLIASSKYNQGLQLIDRILAEHPDDAQAHYVKAIALVKLRRYKDAAAEYRSVLRLQPKESLVDQARRGLKKIGFES